MNKKEYMQPTLEVVKIETAGMLAVSGLDLTGLDGVDFDVNGGDPGDAGARAFDEGNDFFAPEDDWDWSAE